MRDNEIKKAYYISAADLSAAGKGNVPDELISNRHLIYSSPATLAYNSPGAQGFGVKRAGLAIPGSVMLLVSPGCCGRNTTILSELGGYSDKFFYLLMDSTDIVTGRHLKRIPEAVQAVYDGLAEKPSVVMICITCVDALLGTDMERVCRSASEKVGIPVLPCYMYALTREGRKPPMVHVRESVYSLLRPSKRVSTTVNILGNFAPLTDDCELYDILRGLGIKRINEISRAKSFDEYLEMSQANFNLVLNSEALSAAEDLKERLGIPYIELKRLYRLDKIGRQYQLFASALGGRADTEEFRRSAGETAKAFREKYGELRFAVGEGCNANAFELSLALLDYGFRVEEIFASITDDDFIYLDQIAEKSPGTRIYSNLEPTMIYYDTDRVPVDISIGKDAAYYHPEAAREEWSDDIQPFGYTGVRHFFEACAAALERKDSAEVTLSGQHRDRTGADDSAAPRTEPSDIRGLRLKIAPFAPDQSGAAAVFCELGGLTVVVDAGGCAGNICGFDEPRWFSSRSAIFSAGLRDMDAILGRDDRLVEKINDVNDKIDGAFTALIGTPVPAVIATDYNALKRMIEKKTGKPVICVGSDGTRNYDAGAAEAFLALFREYCENSAGTGSGEGLSQTVGILGATPMDLGDIRTDSWLGEYLKRRGFRKAFVYTMGSGIDDIRRAGTVSENIVIAPDALPAARYLQDKFGTPYEEDFPLETIPGLEDILKACEDTSVGSVLIVHEQMLCNALRKRILERRGAAKPVRVTAASWFEMDKEFLLDGDISIRSEGEWMKLAAQGGYDMIIGDGLFRRAVPDYQGRYIDLPHFAVSGKF